MISLKPSFFPYITKIAQLHPPQAILRALGEEDALQQA